MFGDRSPSVSEASVGQHSVLSSTADSLSGGAPMLPQSLINYYDPSLLGHITGWPAEQIELRVSTMSFHCLFAILYLLALVIMHSASAW